MQTPSNSAPDSLQDLCIFFCVEHPECLNISEKTKASHTSDDGGGDAVVSPEHELPITLCDRLVSQFLKTQIPLLAVDRTTLNALLKKKNICSNLNLLRLNILSEANLCDIAQNQISNLNLLGCKEYSHVNDGIEMLMRMNKESLKSLRVVIAYREQTDRGSRFYSFLRDPNAASNFSSHLKDLSLGKTQYNRGDFVYNQRSSKPGPVIISTGSDKEVTLLHCDGGYRTVTEVLNSDWFRFPKLQSFSVINSDSQTGISTTSDLIIWNILASNPQLTTVSIVSNDITFWWTKIPNLENLTSLIMSYSSLRQRDGPTLFFQYLKGLLNLRHLDVSSVCECNYTDDEVEKFAEYVRSAPRLVSLELAGTNLSMIMGHERQCSKNTDFNPVHCLDSCMAPLGTRRFQYLGLLDCPFSVTKHKYILADKVSGTCGGRQILTALWSYQHNPGLMNSLLDYDGVMSHPEQEYSHLYPGAYIEGLLAFLDQYPDWKCIMQHQQPPTLRVIGKVLYHLYKILSSSTNRQAISIIQKRKLLERMLVLLSNCLRDIEAGFTSHVDYVTRLSLVNLLCLPLPDVAAYCYMVDKYVKTLILVVKLRPKPMMMHLALRLIHTACRFTQELKARIGGEFELAKILLTLISDNKVIDPVEDDFYTMENVIEKTWSVMWTLTDEVPSNCERFVRHNGLEISKEIIELHPENSFELHRKITGALSNIAENKNLRPALCREDLVCIMREMLLKTDSSGIDVSSHAAAYLVLLAADGPEAWTVEDPTREAVLKDVETTIDRWQLDASRGVKFRSLNPMTQHLENKECPVAQYWASWMICNLITVKPSRYCVMLREEGGQEILDRLRIKPDLFFKVKNLVNKMADIMEQNKDLVMVDDD